MAGAATIVIARHDLSLLGADADTAGAPQRPADIERSFFELVRVRSPDVIVIDCRGPSHDGIGAIHKVRQRTQTPVLIVCEADDPRQQDYRVAGAADCLSSPFDIVHFNAAIQQIIRLTGPARDRSLNQTRTFAFAGLIYRPSQNQLDGNAVSVRLTTAENHLLLHLLSRPWRVCGRAEIAEVLYGPHRPTNDRAIDLIVTRLRRKLIGLHGAAAENLIKTEFRQGYMLASEVTMAPEEAA